MAFVFGWRLEIGVGEAGIEALAHPLGGFPIGFEFRVQGADQTQGDGALAAGPSQVIPEEAQGGGGGCRAFRLRLVLREGTEAFDFGGATAKAQHRGEVVHDLVAVQRAGEHPEFDDAVGEELAEVDHATAAAVGSVGFPGGVGRFFHLFDQVPDFVAKRAAVIVQVASGARLAVETPGVPPCDVGELAGKFAHCLRVVGADDGSHAHGDMAAARGVHVRPDGVGPPDELQQVFDARSPLEDGGDKLARHAAKIIADGTVAVGPPVVAVEGGGGERLVGECISAAAHGGTAVVAADVDAGRSGDGGFEFNPEGDLLGLGILGSH